MSSTFEFVMPQREGVWANSALSIELEGKFEIGKKYTLTIHEDGGGQA